MHTVVCKAHQLPRTPTIRKKSIFEVNPGLFDFLTTMKPNVGQHRDEPGPMNHLEEAHNFNQSSKPLRNRDQHPQPIRNDSQIGHLRQEGNITSSGKERETRVHEQLGHAKLPYMWFVISGTPQHQAREVFEDRGQPHQKQTDWFLVCRAMALLYFTQSRPIKGLLQYELHV